MIKLPIFILTWILFLLFRTVFILLGLVIVPILSILNEYTTKIELSRINGRAIVNWKWKLFYIWSNDEDGVIAGSELIGYPAWIRMIYWSAIRNPANNLRFIRGLSCPIIADKVKYNYSEIKLIDDSEPYLINLYMYDRDNYRFITLTWINYYSNLRIQFKMFNRIWRFWIGWKIYPHDSIEISEHDYRRFGAGFATQFKRVYPRTPR